MELVTVGYEYSGESGSFKSAKEIYIDPKKWGTEVATWKEDQLNPEAYKILYVYRVENHRPIFLYRGEGVR